MDVRLRQVGPGRLHRLRKPDLPAVANALLAAIRKQAWIDKGEFGGDYFVRIKHEDGDVVIMFDDWVKILPYIQNGFFSTPMVATPVGPDNPDTQKPVPATDYLGLIEKAREGFRLGIYSVYTGPPSPELEAQGNQPVRDGSLVGDKSLYQRILDTLTELFPEDFPTSVY